MRINTLETEEQDISNQKSSSTGLRWVHYLWFAASCALLLILLKPYNRSHKPFHKPDYAFNDQSDKENGYIVDYNGVVDLVSQNGPVACNLLITKTFDLCLTSNVKEDFDEARVVFLKNGYPEDSIDLKQGDRIRSTFRCRKNDYLGFRVFNPNSNRHTEVSIKLEQSNQVVQQAVYAIILLWFVLGLLIAYHRGPSHLFLPSIALLLAVYAEHLYPPEDWFRVMVGFVLLASLLAFIRSLVRMINIRFLRWVFLFVYDLGLVLIILFCASFVLHHVVFGAKLDFDSIVAVLQSNRSEMAEFAVSQTPFWGWICVVAILCLPIVGVVWPGKAVKAPSAASTLGFVAIAGIVGSGLASNSKFGNEFFFAYERYYEEIAKFNEVQERLSKPENLDARKSGKGETYVVVIGESQSKEHMSLYGYHRKTTPFLDSMKRAGELLVIDRAYSSHTHTIMVLQEALTEANQYNGKNYIQVPTLMNVFNAADFETVWLSNQVRLSNWDNVVSAIAEGCEKKIFVNKRIGETVDESPYDQRILPELDKLLRRNVDMNRVIFVHLMGNHGNYNERYPEDFDGLESLGKADFGRNANLDNWEYYDNSMLYNDWIMREVMSRLQRSKSDVKALCYFADHGEDLSDGRGHNIGQFTYRMTQIPMYFWMSDGYREKYPTVVNGLQANRSKVFSNDLIYQTMLGLTGVETPGYDSTYDLTSSHYRLDNPRIKSGKIDYQDVFNPYVQTERNRDSLLAWQMEGRVGVHRVNSYGKSNEVLRDGLGLIEIDIKIRPGEHGVDLMVGHGEDKVMSGQTLTQYLRKMKLSDTTRIWLDIKNLSEENARPLVAVLNRLDVRYDLKNRLIVETSSTGGYASVISEAGFHLSYYLPTDILDKKSIEEQSNMARQVLRQVASQRLSGISFDARLYDWVRENLEGRLPSGIDFHTWDLDMNIRHGEFADRLKAKPYFLDTRVRSILTTYPSVFDL